MHFMGSHFLGQIPRTRAPESPQPLSPGIMELRQPKAYTLYSMELISIAAPWTGERTIIVRFLVIRGAAPVRTGSGSVVH